MRALAIIPARMESRRFPGKPLALILGRPMIQWVWLAASRSQVIFKTFVATPDLEIQKFCLDNGIQVIMTERSCRNGTERCHDACRQIAARDEDIIINVQADEPAIRAESLDNLARAFVDPRVNIASLYQPAGSRTSGDRNRVKVMIQKSGNAFAFSRDPFPMGVDYGLHVGVYAYRRPVLAELARLPARGDLEQTAWMVDGRPIKMLKIDYKTASVDVPGDLEAAGEALEAETWA